MRFIIVTNRRLKNHKMVLNVNGIQAIYRDDSDTFTIIKHTGHNNGGFEVTESTKQILKLIGESEEI